MPLFLEVIKRTISKNFTSKIDQLNSKKFANLRQHLISNIHDRETLSDSAVLKEQTATKESKQKNVCGSQQSRQKMITYIRHSQQIGVSGRQGASHFFI